MKAQSIKAGEGSSGILREETASMLVSTKPAQPVSTEVAKTEAGNPSPIMPVPVNTAASTALNTDGVEKEDVVAMYALDMIQMRKASNRRRYAQLVIASALTVAVLQDDDVFKFVVEKRRAAFNTLSKASGSSMTALTGAGKRSVMTLNGARKASLSKLGELRRKVFERDDSQQ
eukprot:8021165-Pyramimonas_sp.AAC.1